MHASPHSFLILQICGLWRPVDWSNGSCKTIFYKSYTACLAVLIVCVVSCELLHLLTNVESIEALATNSFMFLSMMGMAGKALNILTRRNRLIELTDTLRNDTCRPRDSVEEELQQEFDATIRLNTLRYGTLTATTVILMYIGSLIQDTPQKELPFPTWVPWDHQSTWASYWIAYVCQTVAHCAGASINVACDSLVAGLMVQICAQFHLLKQRLRSVPKTVEDELTQAAMENKEQLEHLEGKILARCVKHHLEILDCANLLCTMFEEIIFLQFSISTVILCVSVYQLSSLKIFGAEFTSITLYVSCMLVQVFFPCYYGSEITLESSNIGNDIYEMNWDTLSIPTKRSLLTIMARTLKPLKCTSGSVIVLNLDSFTALIKLSYSAFNLLQQS